MRFLAILSLLLTSSIAHSEEVLPRVLIIGDSIYSQNTSAAAKELKGRAEIVFVKLEQGEVCSTQTALEKLDVWLGDKKWDLIHFNFGLGDLVHRAPGMKSLRLMPIPEGGIRNTSAVQYERNLQELVKRLKTTGAKLIWASTTPIRHSSTQVFEKGSEIEYNMIAARVMKEHKVPINDMYAYVLNLIDMTKPAGHGADPFNFDKKPIHEPVVAAIVAAIQP